MITEKFTVKNLQFLQTVSQPANTRDYRPLRCMIIRACYHYQAISRRLSVIYYLELFEIAVSEPSEFVGIKMQPAKSKSLCPERSR